MSLTKKVYLTISGYDIKLSDNLMFYQNDQLKLIFYINEYGIDYENNATTRALMPVNPLNAILFIENPDGVDSVSSAKIEDNAVTFYLDSTHTQFVGVSRMQIRLFDQDGCVVTLPHFTFEIRENIYGDTEVKFENVVLIDNDGSAIVTESGQMLDVGDIMLIDVEAVYPETQKEISGLPQKTTFTGAERLLIQDDEGAKQIALQKLVEAISSLELSEVAKTGDYNDLINKPDLSDYVTTQVLSTKVDKVNGKGLSTNDYTDEDKVKLRSLANPDVNKAYVDNELAKKVGRNELTTVATTGSYNDLMNKPDLSVYATTQSLSTKVDKVSGKGLSTNDYTNADMEKLRSLTNSDVNKAYVDAQLVKKANASHTHSEYLTEHQDISGKVNRTELATVATSGSYNDLTNKPTIPNVSNFATMDYVNNQLSNINLSSYQRHTDSGLQTSNKTIVGAINELYALLQNNGGSGGGGSSATYGEIILSKTSSLITAGNSDTFTVRLDKQPTNNQIITISVNNSYVNVNSSYLTFTPSNWNINQTVTLNGVSSGNSTITLSSPNVSTKTINVTVNASSSGGSIANASDTPVSQQYSSSHEATPNNPNPPAGSYNWVSAPRINPDGSFPVSTWNAIGHWMTTYKVSGSSYYDNVGLLLQNPKMWIWNTSTRSWDVLSEDFEWGTWYREDFWDDGNGNISGTTEWETGVSGNHSKWVKIKQTSETSGRCFHPWGYQKNWRSNSNWSNNGQPYIVTKIDFKLVKWNESGTDNLDYARLVVNSGADWWRNVGDTWQSDWSTNRDMAVGKYILATRELKRAWCTNVPSNWSYGFPTD